MVNVTFKIFLLYHTRKYINKNFSFRSPGPLHFMYSGAVKKNHLTIITALLLQE